jgi:hypothetical protein
VGTQKVGNWVEYYPTGKRKKLVAYPKEPFDKEVIPYVKTEWNEKGREIYRNNKMSTIIGPISGMHLRSEQLLA